MTSTIEKLEWGALMQCFRASHKDRQATKKTVQQGDDSRTQSERDYDRILFSAPVRRLADKTQVFPMERHDSIRNRLTHSHEVSNLARSIGITIAETIDEIGALDKAPRRIPAALAAIGLAHDLGNPPFGHQGEAAIQTWFSNHKDEVFTEEFNEQMRQDFLKFEGNAQTFRVLTRLQTVTNDRGLNLTYGTLAAVLKYPVSSDRTGPCVATKKHGYFFSERAVIEDVWKVTGLSEAVRHPLTWIMEACDDIAYSVLDAEDATKKGIVSASDLFAALQASNPDDPVTTSILDKCREEQSNFRMLGLSPGELDDATMQMFRVMAIGRMVSATARQFSERYEDIMAGRLSGDLISSGECASLCSALKKFDRENAYQNRAVLALELQGFNTIYRLMDMLWFAITCRKDRHEPSSRRKTPFARYAYGRISENYRRIFEGRTSSSRELPVAYRQAQLLTDMLAGMTDTFAIDLCQELESFREGPSYDLS